MIGWRSDASLVELKEPQDERHAGPWLRNEVLSEGWFDEA